MSDKFTELFSAQGLSLDYIHELTTTSKSTTSDTSSATACTPEEALEQHKNEIKLDIVARFNAAQRAGKCVFCSFKCLNCCIAIAVLSYIQCTASPHLDSQTVHALIEMTTKLFKHLSCDTVAVPKVKPHKFSTANVSKPARENNTFGFLNKIEINKPVTVSSGGNSGAVSAVNAKKAAAHRNPNVSKLF